MIISEKTRDLLFEIREYSENTLSDFNDVSVLIENIFYSEDKQKFLDLIFKAKFLSGMLTIFADDTKEQSTKEKISDEFQVQLTGFINEFKSSTENFSQQDKDFFERKYFQLTPDSLGNNIRLLKDLTIVKNFFLDKPKFLKN
jgi:hypothetical protein